MAKGATDTAGLRGDEIKELSSMLPQYWLKSRSVSTSKKYYGLYKKWEQFVERNGTVCIPAKPIAVALFLASLMENGASSQTVTGSVYAIKWVHELHGHKFDAEDPFIKNTVDAAKRQFKPPIKRKDPVTSTMLITLCDKFECSLDLIVIRDLAIMLFRMRVFTI